MISEKKYVSIPAHVMAREVGGEIVLLNLDNERYYGLDEVGTRMWLALTTASSVQEALDSLHDEYDVSVDELKNDLDELLSELISQGLLELHDR